MNHVNEFEFELADGGFKIISIHPDSQSLEIDVKIAAQSGKVLNQSHRTLPLEGSYQLVEGRDGVVVYRDRRGFGALLPRRRDSF